MKVVRFSHEGLQSWGLLDDAVGIVRHVAGTFANWAPRIANGETHHALPCTGRSFRLPEVELLAPIEDNATVHDEEGLADRPFEVQPASSGSRVTGEAVGLALVGAPLIGRLNPLRSLFGYSQGWRCGLGAQNRATLTVNAALTPRNLFGDDEHELASRWGVVFGPTEGLPDESLQLAALMTELNSRSILRVGDAVVFPLRRTRVRDVVDQVACAHGAHGRVSAPNVHFWSDRQLVRQQPCG